MIQRMIKMWTRRRRRIAAQGREIERLRTALKAIRKLTLNHPRTKD